MWPRCAELTPNVAPNVDRCAELAPNVDPPNVDPQTVWDVSPIGLAAAWFFGGTEMGHDDVVPPGGIAPPSDSRDVWGSSTGGDFGGGGDFGETPPATQPAGGK
jgi:hypothetical protein